MTPFYPSTMSENQENAPSESLKPYSYEGGYSSFSTTIDNSGTSNIRFLGDMENNSTPWVTNDDDTDMSESAYDGELSDFAPSIPWRGLTDESNPSRAPSINSYHSSMDGYLFRDVQGRIYNNMNLAYRLPADIEEHDRLTKQHIMICNYTKGLYPAKDIVEYLLRPGQEERPTVLDVGAGSGAWLIDMANKFPETDFIGLDLVPPKLGNRELPDNCRFEIDDANLSMTHWTNAFDLVHVTALDDGIHDFEHFLYNVAQTMKPGALLIIGGGSIKIYDENDEPPTDVEGQPGFSWVQKFFSTFFVQYVSGGIKEGKHWKWADWLNDNPNYEDVVSWLMPLPIGNWKQASSAEEFYANEINRRNLLDMCRNYAPILVAEGFPKDVVDRWATGVEKELTELKVHSFSKWKWTWCRRTSNEWIPSPKDKSGGMSLYQGGKRSDVPPVVVESTVITPCRRQTCQDELQPRANSSSSNVRNRREKIG